MATFFGVEQTKEEASRRRNADNKQGKHRVLYDTFVTHATLLDMAIGDFVIIGVLPAGARILGGHLSFGAMGAGATADVGSYSRNGAVFTAVVEDRWLAALDVSAAGQALFANTIALNNYELLTAAETWIGVQAEGADWADGIACHCAIEYVAD